MNWIWQFVTVVRKKAFDYLVLYVTILFEYLVLVIIVSSIIIL